LFVHRVNQLENEEREKIEKRSREGEEKKRRSREGEDREEIKRRRREDQEKERRSREGEKKEKRRRGKDEPKGIAGNSCSSNLNAEAVGNKSHSELGDTISDPSLQHVEVERRRHRDDVAMFLAQHMRENGSGTCKRRP